MNRSKGAGAVPSPPPVTGWRGMVGKVGFELHLPPEFPKKYEGAIVRAVEQCTVKRHLHQPPDFTVMTSRALSA